MALRLAGEELGVVQGDVAAAATLDEANQEFLKTLAALYGFDGTDLVRLMSHTPADGLAVPTNPLDVLSIPHGFNGSTLDRWRNNYDVTVFSSGARANTQTSPDQTNYNARGITVMLDITSMPGSHTAQLKIQDKDKASGKYYDLLVDAAQSTTATRVAVLVPGAGAAADAVDITRGFALPRVWRVQIVHTGGGSNIIYSVGASYHTM